MANEDVVAGRVLLVEDSMIIALDTEECLLQIGAAAVTVEGTVAGALEALATQDFAFALLDFRLGTDTGEPVAEALRTRGIPFWLATGYNEMADTNNIVVLYPQAEGIDDGATQNPEGCWDWWGYSSDSASHPDYYSKQAIQIRAIHAMLQRLGGQ